MTTITFDYHDFGRRLKEILDQRNISVAELAKLTGKRTTYISNLLEDDANPTIKTVGIIANALEIPAEELIRSQTGEISAERRRAPDNVFELYTALDPESQSLVDDLINLLKDNK